MDEQKNKTAAEATPNEELVFSFVGANGRILIRFKDGAHILPEYVVAGLGGASAVKEAADQLASVTYEEFIQGFNQMTERRALNDFQRAFTGAHFGRLNRGGRF